LLGPGFGHVLFPGFVLLEQDVFDHGEFVADVKHFVEVFLFAVNVDVFSVGVLEVAGDLLSYLCD
jgi:hypothetical protein